MPVRTRASTAPLTVAEEMWAEQCAKAASTLYFATIMYRTGRDTRATFLVVLCLANADNE